MKDELTLLHCVGMIDEDLQPIITVAPSVIKGEEPFNYYRKRDPNIFQTNYFGRAKFILSLLNFLT